jgi:hypothetical protein
MFLIKLICKGIPRELGPKAAINITEEFNYCSRRVDAICHWSGDALQLEAISKFGSDAKALAEEFSEAISACVAEQFDGAILVEQVVRISDVCPKAKDILANTRF